MVAWLLVFSAVPTTLFCLLGECRQQDAFTDSVERESPILHRTSNNRWAYTAGWPAVQTVGTSSFDLPLIVWDYNGPRMYDRVLVATDGDESSDVVLEHALSIAADNDATLHGLFVVDRRVYSVAFDDGPSEKKTELREVGKAALADVEAAADDAGVDVETELREGDPERVVAAYGDEIEADLIVVGSHGKSPKEKVQGLGSVSEAVVKSTSRPTLVVGITADA